MIEGVGGWGDSFTPDTFILGMHAPAQTPLTLMSALLAVKTHSSEQPRGHLSHLEGLSKSCHIIPSIHLDLLRHGYEEWVNNRPVFSTHSPFPLCSIRPLAASEIRYWRFANDGVTKKTSEVWICEFLQAAMSINETLVGRRPRTLREVVLKL